MPNGHNGRNTISGVPHGQGIPTSAPRFSIVVCKLLVCSSTQQSLNRLNTGMAASDVRRGSTVLSARIDDSAALRQDADRTARRRPLTGGQVERCLVFIGHLCFDVSSGFEPHADDFAVVAITPLNVSGTVKCYYEAIIEYLGVASVLTQFPCGRPSPPCLVQISVDNGPHK